MKPNHGYGDSHCQTLQDRLTKELRLGGISSLEQANAYLPEFIAAYNARFAVAPRSTESRTGRSAKERTSIGY